ncbi:MAG: thymidine phosphorylase family protein [Bradymonadaceae bacterium]
MDALDAVVRYTVPLLVAPRREVAALKTDELDVENTLRVRRLGFQTHQESVVYMRDDCPVCRSEGFEAQSRVEVAVEGRSTVATLCLVNTDVAGAQLLDEGEAGLSEAAWRRLGEPEGGTAQFSHPPTVDSLSAVRRKIYGGELDESRLLSIVRDVVDGLYADVHLAAFLSACAGGRMSVEETAGLTRAMIEVGERLDWETDPVVDKHCVGGLPGNRTTPIVVSIAAARGLTMPKTSSRAITSPAGTADTMGVLAPVDLTPDEIRQVVRREHGCVAWGGSVRLSPADDVLIRIERALDLDSTSQLVASVLSKKAAAGSSHVVIDMPVGPTVKVRSERAADELEKLMHEVADRVGLTLTVVRTDGRQPVGRGIGPALEAKDVLGVLQNYPDAPRDLRDRSTRLAGRLLEAVGDVDGDGQQVAEQTIDDGLAWETFRAICDAQGGMRTPPTAAHRTEVAAPRGGTVRRIDNRKLARVAKLAGAPDDPAAGLEFCAPLGAELDAGDPLFVLHAESPGEIRYALDYAEQHPDIVEMEDG